MTTDQFEKRLREDAQKLLPPFSPSLHLQTLSEIEQPTFLIQPRRRFPWRSLLAIAAVLFMGIVLTRLLMPTDNPPGPLSHLSDDISLPVFRASPEEVYEQSMQTLQALVQDAQQPIMQIESDTRRFGDYLLRQLPTTFANGRDI